MGTTQEQFNVGGLSCSFWAGSIEEAYNRTDGVEDVFFAPDVPVNTRGGRP